MRSLVYPKIALIGYEEMINSILNVIDLDNYECELYIKTAYDHECLEIIPELKREKVDIIITGNINKKIFERNCDIPTISFKITSYDILTNIVKVYKDYKSIAIAIPADQGLYDFSFLSKMFGVNIQMIFFENEIQLKNEIKEFAITGGIVIGSSLSVSIARDYNLDGRIVYTLQSTIDDSINRAKEIIYFKEKEKKVKLETESMINTIKDGILSTNFDGEITLINPTAIRMLGIKNSSIIGRSVKEVISTDLINWFLKEEIIENSILNVNNHALVMNKVPITLKKITKGYIYVFHDITKIQKMDNRYRIKSKKSSWVAKNSFDDIVCKSKAMKKVVDHAKRFAETNSTILIKGDTGTGKEMVAQSIHNHSSRREFPFVPINCAALPDNLLESELFGYKDGAFTGASQKGKKGLFEIAHKGTIFLDEINSTSISFQVKLLRVLQEREIVPIGSDEVVNVDIRIIVATNANLFDLIAEDKFRADLYYRLNVLEISIPSLKDRIEDLPVLISNYYKRYSVFFNVIKFKIGFISKILSFYDFPGNVRELNNILERFMLLCEINNLEDETYLKEILLDNIDSKNINVPDLDCPLQINDKNNSYEEVLQNYERNLIKYYYQKYEGNKTKLAKSMNITRSTLYKKLNELELFELL